MKILIVDDEKLIRTVIKEYCENNNYTTDEASSGLEALQKLKTNDYDLQYKYQEESDKLRKPALISMVDDYGIKIKDEHQQTYKDFKEQATVINKENESKSFADKLASEMTFEKSTDEFGYVEFSTIVLLITAEKF